MTKAQIDQLDSLQDGVAMRCIVSLDGRLFAVINNGVFRQRKPHPIGLAWEITAPRGKKNSVFVMPTYCTTLYIEDVYVLRVRLRSYALLKQRLREEARHG